KLFLFAALAVTVSLSSCKKDKEDPTITVNEPTEHSHHMWGETVHVEATFADDMGLKSYEVLLGDEAGNHDHMFDFDVSGTINGTEYDFHEHFVVPDSAEMMRYIHFTVT